MIIIREVGDLDPLMAACDAAKTDDDLRAIFASFRMELEPEPSLDPFSSSYYDQQMALYRRISGRQYELSSEATPFDLDQAVRTPFPYSTGSCQTAGDHFVLIGEFLRHMQLPHGAKVLEFGPGWGNLTLALAALGYQVTCVDIENRFCELIRRRADKLDLTLSVINADFSWAAKVTSPFDAVIFFECFHHAADHLDLLRNLHTAVKPGGRVYMGAEPILTDFPVPWGLRLDGQSLWSIRKFGWMELGFRDDYFQAALAKTGWAGKRHSIVNPAIWELTSTRMPLWFGMNDPRVGTLTGNLVGPELALSNAAAGVAVFGPYATITPGQFAARIHYSTEYPLIGKGRMEVCALGANKELASCTVDMAHLLPEQPYLQLPFNVDEIYQDVEVRLINEAGFSGYLKAIEIVQIV